MARFLLDENVPVRLSDALKRRGFQARLAIEALGPGAKNSDILELARGSEEIVIYVRLRFYAPAA